MNYYANDITSFSNVLQILYERILKDHNFSYINHKDLWNEDPLIIFLYVYIQSIKNDRKKHQEMERQNRRKMEIKQPNLDQE